ncbi:MAG: MATE family efflux transporter, partial [Sphaerochaetaceae bacterium]
MEKRSLATAFSNRYIMALALPLMAELFLGVLIGFADTVMVSSCGQSAVSGVSLVDTLSQLVIQVLSAFATAGSVVAAQYLGRGEASKASEASRQLIVASFAASSMMVAACILLREPIIDMVFGSIEPSVREASCTYFVWIFLSYPFLAVFNCCTATFRAMGNGSLQLKVSLFTNVLNIAGNAL